MATPPPPHRWSIIVGRIASIDIRIHATFLILIVLFAVAAPEPGAAGVGWSLLWLAALFGSVVLHELAHSLVARRRGGEVHEILLFPLGGVSKLEHLPETAADEFAVAIVGPLTSLGLGVAALGVGAALGGSLVPVDLLGGAWLVRLGWLNLLLGVFNLLPAFPLDGGRVLRALLERRHDLIGATRIATRVGHALAGVLIAVGLLFDLWLALIGMFVYFGASAEEAGTIAHARLRGHRVREFVLRAPNLTAEGGEEVSIDEPLDVELLGRLERASGSLIVVDHDAPVGLLLLSDVKGLLAPDEPHPAGPVGA
jgi:Zn-dependent protease